MGFMQTRSVYAPDMLLTTMKGPLQNSGLVLRI